jgi:WD40 repeat protein
MNKELFDQLPADEQPVAAKLNSVSENMKVPQAFQWTLESQLMDAFQKKSQPNKGWFSKLIVPAAWTLAAVLGIFLLTWAIRSVVPSEQTQPSAPNTEMPVETFEGKVRQGNICKGPLALEHGFATFLTNQDKTGFITLDEEKAIDELRSFAWSTDGEQLAILGNTTGGGNIYLTDSSSLVLQPVLAHSPMGYLFFFTWSRDGKQFVTWSSDNQKNIYLFNADGSDVKEVALGMQILGTPQFSPDGKSIFFRGADTSAFGLFELALDGSQTRLISKQLEDESGFAWSPDGLNLAYIEMDRELGEARLILEKTSSGSKVTLGTLPIPKGSGSSIPNVANLSWSQDGTKLVFEFGRGALDRAIYLAYADGSGMVKVVDSAHAPSISADGNCLAYISNKQVFFLDLSSSQSEPLLLADLPGPRGTTDFRLDKLQWQP